MSWLQIPQPFIGLDGSQSVLFILGTYHDMASLQMILLWLSIEQMMMITTIDKNILETIALDRKYRKRILQPTLLKIQAKGWDGMGYESIANQSTNPIHCLGRNALLPAMIASSHSSLAELLHWRRNRTHSMSRQRSIHAILRMARRTMAISIHCSRRSAMQRLIGLSLEASMSPTTCTWNTMAWVNER